MPPATFTRIWVEKHISSRNKAFLFIPVPTYSSKPVVTILFSNCFTRKAFGGFPKTFVFSKYVRNSVREKSSVFLFGGIPSALQLSTKLAGLKNLIADKTNFNRETTPHGAFIVSLLNNSNYLLHWLLLFVKFRYFDCPIYIEAYQPSPTPAGLHQCQMS